MGAAGELSNGPFVQFVPNIKVPFVYCIELRFPILAKIDAELEAVFALDFGETFKNLEYVQGAFGAAGIAQGIEAGSGKGYPRQDLARSVGRKIAGQTKRSGIVAKREIGQGLDKAGPIQPAIHEKCGADGVNVVERKAPVESLQVVPRRGIVVNCLPEPVSATPHPKVVSRPEEELVPIREIDVEPANRVVEAFRSPSVLERKLACPLAWPGWLGLT